MNPITRYLKNLLAKKRLLGEDSNVGAGAKAEDLLVNLVNENQVPGLAITVLKDGKYWFRKGYGYADLEAKKPVDQAQTIFRIASVSKPIAATALAQMVLSGDIDLDASFYDYVPYYPKKKYDFTIRQLAGHTAGIRGYRGTEYGLDQPYTIKESIAIFKDDPLLFEPGTDYNYTSYDWVLISLAMQEVSGIPFETYVKQQVLEPLGMTATFAPGPDGDLEAGYRSGRMATFYSKKRKGFRKAIPVNNHYKLAGGGYCSTTEDIAKLGQAYLENEMVNESLRSQFLTSLEIGGSKTYYGLGWQVSEDHKGRPYYGHIGNGVGGYSNFFVYPRQQLVVVILINCTDPKVQPVLDEIVDNLVEASSAQV